MFVSNFPKSLSNAHGGYFLGINLSHLMDIAHEIATPKDGGVVLFDDGFSAPKTRGRL